MILDPANPTHETKRQRDARLLREAARRSREWRQKQREQRSPDSRATHAAITEAVAFLSFAQAYDANARTFLPGADGPVFTLKRVVQVATACLRRDGYAFGASSKRVIAALAPRSDHDSPVRVPSRRPVEGPVMLPPPRGADAWSDHELGLLCEFMTIGDRRTMR